MTPSRLSALARAPRYRQRMVAVPLGLDDPVWVDERAFDLARHVRGCEHGDFGRLVDEVMSTPLQHDRALWELWIAGSPDDGRIGVVGKAHHCLVDGFAAVELVALLLDATPEPEPACGEGGWSPCSAPSAPRMVGDAVAHQLDKAVAVARAAALDARPAHAARRARAGLERRPGRRPHRPALARPNRLNGAMPAARHLAWHSRPFEDLRVIKRHFGTTVNDVLLSASAGALRGLLQERTEPLRDAKAMVPVSVQAPDERWGNRIAFMFLELPCGEANPVWRLRDIHVAMRERKREGEPQGADALLTALSYAPRAVRRVASRLLASPTCRTSRSRTSRAPTCRCT